MVHCLLYAAAKVFLYDVTTERITGWVGFEENMTDILSSSGKELQDEMQVLLIFISVENMDEGMDFKRKYKECF